MTAEVREWHRRSNITEDVRDETVESKRRRVTVFRRGEAAVVSPCRSIFILFYFFNKLMKATVCFWCDNETLVTLSDQSGKVSQS